MTTARDLDNRLTYREISSQGAAPFTYSEVLVFASDLQVLLVSEGFTVTWEPTRGMEQYLYVWMGPGYLKLLVSASLYIHVLYGNIPMHPINSESVVNLVRTLHLAASRQAVMDYCGSCQYSDRPLVNHCGKGMTMVPSGCKGYERRRIECSELDDRLSYRNTTQQTMVPFNSLELVAFTSDLCTLLASEGFDVVYEPTPYPHYQNLYVQLAPGTDGIIRLIVRCNGLVYTDRWLQYESASGYTIQIVLNTLHRMATRLYCGMGRPLTGSDCTDYIGKTQP